MKLRTAFFLFVVILLSAKIQAQLVVASSSTLSNPSYKTQTAKALTELSLGINQDAYQKTFFKAKNDFLNKSAGTLTTKDASQNIITLLQFIKPAKFRKGFDTQGFVKNVNSIATMKQANDLIKKFEEGLTPNAFVPMWKMQRSNWLNTLK